MKKVLIVGYFVSMLSFTYVVALVVSTFKSGSVEYKIRTKKEKISDTEAIKLNFEIKDDKSIERTLLVKEKRTKHFLGWETKVDTISVDYNYIN